jgi:hypothetical protein
MNHSELIRRVIIATATAALTPALSNAQNAEPQEEQSSEVGGALEEVVVTATATGRKKLEAS